MKPRWQRKGVRQRPSDHHTDDWLMTYADMITLLLCFFAVFLSVSVPKKEVPKTPPAIIVSTVTPPPPVQIPPQPDSIKGDLPFYGTAQDDPPPESVADSSVAPPAPSLPEIVDHLKTQGAADIEQQGDRITTIAMDSGAFFAVGSATLSAAGESILRDVATNLKADKYADYQITVEGHTDDSPIHTALFPSNWELSTARAAAVVRFFLTQGLDARKLRAAGYADTFPRAPNRDAQGTPIPANQALNRRVVIKLERIEKADDPAKGP